VFTALGLDYKAPHERSLDETTVGSMAQQGAHQGNEQVSKHLHYRSMHKLPLYNSCVKPIALLN
jgi:hypothetical protein